MMMASERQLQFRIGLLVLVAMATGGWLVYEFGDFKQLAQKRYPLSIHFESAAGLYPTAPVTFSGLTVGSVRLVQLDERRGGVMVSINVREDVRIPTDSRAVIVRSILGETAIDITAGRETDAMKPGARFEGLLAADPLEMVQRMEGRAIEVLDAVTATSKEWQVVAQNLNGLMETKRGDLDQVIERASESLRQFTVAISHVNALMASANKIVGDPESQQALHDTLVAMPKLVNETHRTIAETRSTVASTRLAMDSTRQVLDNVNKNLVNLTQLTEPVGKRGEQMVAKLDSSLTSLDQLMTELSRFARLVNSKDGSMQKFATDPSLYDNLDRSSQQLVVLLRNVEPMMRDLREFSDKVARHPEVLGVGGAVLPSTGLKDTELLHPQKHVARGNGTK
jgi:phospholipid/cholesterol/gamma-HCH transport system substrate-binding protein